MSGMQKMKELHAIHSENAPQLQKILSPEQYQQLQAIREADIKKRSTGKRVADAPDRTKEFNRSKRREQRSGVTKPPFPPVQTQVPRRFPIGPDVPGLAHRRAGNFDHASERVVHLQDNKNRC